MCYGAVFCLCGCVTMPPPPLPGPQQKTAYSLINPYCLFWCAANNSQSTALEDIRNNAGPVQGGDQSEANTQSATQNSTATLKNAPTNNSANVEKKDNNP